MRAMQFILIAVLLIGATSLEACGRRGDLSAPPSSDSENERQ